MSKRLALFIPLLWGIGLAGTTVTSSQAEASTSAVLVKGGEKRSVRVEGVVGESLENAIAQGLVRALEQVQGISVDSSQGAQLRHSERVKEVTDGASEYFARTADKDIATGTISRATRGIIDSYTIESQQQDPETRRWTISLTVVVPIYDPDHPRPGSKWTLVVLPLSTPQSQFDLGGVKVNAKELSRKLLDRSTSQFARSGRFLVLDRRHAAHVSKERAGIDSANAPIAEKVALGQALGADFLVTGSLEEISWSESERTLVTGRSVVNRIARYHASVQLIQVSTGVLKFSEQVQGLIGERELGSLPPEYLDLRRDDLLLELLAQDMASLVTRTLYPPTDPTIKVISARETVMEVDGETANRGRVIVRSSDRAAVGDEFDIYSKGEELRDPDTGELLGVDEVKVGRIRIVEKQGGKPTMVAVLILGDVEAIEPGAICRPVSKTSESRR